MHTDPNWIQMNRSLYGIIDHEYDMWLTNVILEIAEIFLEADTYRRKSHCVVVSEGLVRRIKLM